MGMKLAKVIQRVRCLRDAIRATEMAKLMSHGLGKGG